ncbi:SusE domain-containing protein [Chryseobacterium sp. A321]
MKKQTIIQKGLLALVMLLGLMACQDREELNISNETPAILMDLSSESLFLDQNFPDNPALNVSWQQAKYTQPTEVKYKIEASTTEGFEEAYTLGTVTGSIRTVTYTVSEMNKAAQTLGIPAGEEGTMYLRVSSYIGDGGEYLSVLSNVTHLTITPYNLVYPTFYLVGDASYVGWSAGDAQELYKSESKSIIYTYMEKDKGFRFLGQKDWNPINYSIDLAGTKDGYRYFKQVSDNLVQDGEENMKFTQDTGIYKVEIDAAAGVQSLTVEASPVKGFDFPVIYLVGSVNAWAAETALPMAKVSAGVYTIDITLADNEEFKFLGQQSWGDLEWANILKDNAGHSGFLGPKGDNGNIQFSGGGAEYTITVNLKAGTYTIVAK